MWKLVLNRIFFNFEENFCIFFLFSCFSLIVKAFFCFFVKFKPPAVLLTCESLRGFSDPYCSFEKNSSMVIPDNYYTVTKRASCTLFPSPTCHLATPGHPLLPSPPCHLAFFTIFRLTRLLLSAGTACKAFKEKRTNFFLVPLCHPPPICSMFIHPFGGPICLAFFFVHPQSLKKIHSRNGIDRRLTDT